MSTFQPTQLTPEQEQAAIHHVQHLLTVEPDIFLRMQLSLLEMLVYYYQKPEQERLGLRTPDDVFGDTMHLCGLLDGVYMAKG